VLFLKKKYRVTTKGKVVFSSITLLVVLGVFLMLRQPAGVVNPENTVSDHASQTQEITEVDSTEVGEVVTGTSNEDISSNETAVDEATEKVKLLESAGFTIYYEPNEYYVPDSDLHYLIEFVDVALEYPDEEIIIEGNVNVSIGPSEEWDTEEVDHLGYTRALVIKNDLIKRGISEDKIVIYNNKDEKPLNVDLSPESVGLNRRVDVFFSQFIYKEINNK
jgi:outer membrane protein OmpA-like peptidoglycan-associated protein